jgi:hypothetical protein
MSLARRRGDGFLQEKYLRGCIDGGGKAGWTVGDKLSSLIFY